MDAAEEGKEKRTAVVKVTVSAKWTDDRPDMFDNGNVVFDHLLFGLNF